MHQMCKDIVLNTINVTDFYINICPFIIPIEQGLVALTTGAHSRGWKEPHVPPEPLVADPCHRSMGLG